MMSWLTAPAHMIDASTWTAWIVSVWLGGKLAFSDTLLITPKLAQAYSFSIHQPALNAYRSTHLPKETPTDRFIGGEALAPQILHLMVLHNGPDTPRSRIIQLVLHISNLADHDGVRGCKRANFCKT